MGSKDNSQVWFITGCSSGFGAAFTREALSRGHKVIATARNLDTLKPLAALGADTMQLDVTAPLDTLRSKASEAYALYNRLDYLVNNAGYVASGTLEEITPEETERIFQTNVFGLLNVTRAFLPYLRKQRSGVIVNIGSMSGWQGYPGQGMYAVSKRAVMGFSEIMSAELAELGVKACSVEPGSFRSNLLSGSNIKHAKPSISDYDETMARKVVAHMGVLDNKQAGDVQKGVKAVVDILTGVAGKEIPVRIVLGPDAHESTRNVCDGILKLLDETKELTTATNHDGA